MVIITKSVSQPDRAEQGSANSRTFQRQEFLARFTGTQSMPCIGHAQEEARYRPGGQINRFVKIDGG